ncbi:Cof-type HAD-IIB family hydrolase [Clostridium sp. DL1XJH146]
MEYKLICIDMDNTLLNIKGEISEVNKQALRLAIKKGVHIAVTTGRIFVSARNFAEILGVKTPVIASNGAYIREKDKEKVIYEKTLTQKNCFDIYEIVKKYSFLKMFNTHDTVCSPEDYPERYLYIKYNESLPENKRVKLLVEKNIEKFIRDEKDNILKFIAISRDADDLKKAREEISLLEDVDVVSSGEMNFEVSRKGVCKGTAVKVLAEMYNIKQEEIICIGDNENDISMIKYAGLGVAMGNALDSVKKVAQYVTDTNDNDGVAKVIEKFVLNSI